MFAKSLIAAVAIAATFTVAAPVQQAEAKTTRGRGHAADPWRSHG